MKNFAAPMLLIVAASAPLATRAQHVVGGDLSDALGQAVGRDFERANDRVTAGSVDPNSIFFEPRGREFRQERPEDLVQGHGFEAMFEANDCGDHGCAEPTTVTTVVSPNGARAQTTGAADFHGSVVHARSHTAVSHMQATLQIGQQASRDLLPPLEHCGHCSRHQTAAHCLGSMPAGRS